MRDVLLGVNNVLVHRSKLVAPRNRRIRKAMPPHSGVTLSSRIHRGRQIADQRNAEKVLSRRLVVSRGSRNMQRREAL